MPGLKPIICHCLNFTAACGQKRNESLNIHSVQVSLFTYSKQTDCRVTVSSTEQKGLIYETCHFTCLFNLNSLFPLLELMHKIG